MNVVFKVYELPLIVELKFDGLRSVAKEELLAELREQKVEIKTGETYEPQKLQKARYTITEYLGKRGFVDAKVDVSTEEVSATTLIVAFIIDEQQNDDEVDYCEK